MVLVGKPLRPVGGFTLIEVMVVVVIIGIMASLVVATLKPDPSREADAEAWRLARLVERLTRESDLSGQVFALRWQPGGYAFFMREDNGEWLPVQSDSVFDARQFPPGIKLLDSGELRFAPEGEFEPRRWILSADTVEMTVILAPLGEVSVERKYVSGDAL